MFGIQYTISVCIKYLNPHSNAILDCLATESLIIARQAVAEPLLDNSTLIVVEPEIFPIQGFCSNKGSMLLGFDTSSTVMAPNTVVGIGVLGKNLSVVDVQYLKAQLVQNIRLCAYGPMHIPNRVIAQTKIGASQAWAPLSASSFKSGEYRYSNPKFSEMEASRVQGCLRVPSGTMESFQGQHIQITNAIVITAVTTGTFSVIDPQ